MANFKYRAKDKYGRTVSGNMTGEDKGAVAKQLDTAGYVPISVEEFTEGKDILSRLLSGMLKRVSLEELALFTRQLLTLQESGVAMMLALGTLEKQAQNRYFKEVIRDVASSVEHGSSLSEALAKHPDIFTELYVNMIKAGEASGSMEEMLRRLAEFEEKDMDNRSKIKSATRYPMMTLGALFFAFLVMVNFVIPKFSSIFGQFNKALPLPTRIMLGLSYFMRHYWLLIIIMTAAVVYAFVRYMNTKNGRLVWDTFTLKVPIFGKLVSMLTMSRFARTMSILLKSGLPVLQVLDMSARTVGNARISAAVNSISENVREGKGISGPMSLSGLFPPMVVQMVAIGEDTGKVDELLLKVSDYYDQQSDYMMKNLSTMIEPIFVLCLGAMVLVVALSVFLPMWNLISVFNH
jgi:type II secretory pathway component PulF